MSYSFAGMLLPSKLTCPSDFPGGRMSARTGRCFACSLLNRSVWQRVGCVGGAFRGSAFGPRRHSVPRCSKNWWSQRALRRERGGPSAPRRVPRSPIPRCPEAWTPPRQPPTPLRARAGSAAARPLAGLRSLRAALPPKPAPRGPRRARRLQSQSPKPRARLWRSAARGVVPCRPERGAPRSGRPLGDARLPQESPPAEHPRAM